MTAEQLAIENKRLRNELQLSQRQLNEIARMAMRHGAPTYGSALHKAKFLFDLLGW